MTKMTGVWGGGKGDPLTRVDRPALRLCPPVDRSSREPGRPGPSGTSRKTWMLVPLAPIASFAKAHDPVQRLLPGGSHDCA